MSTSQGQYLGDSASSTTQSPVDQEFRQGVIQSEGAPSGMMVERRAEEPHMKSELLEMSGEAGHRTLLPPFSSRSYSHLPTPQSPTNFRQYNNGIFNSPDSPITHAPSSFSALGASSSQLPPISGEPSIRGEIHLPPLAKQHLFMTPESSPSVPRSASLAQADTFTSRTDHPPSRINLSQTLSNASTSPSTLPLPTANIPSSSSRSATPTNNYSFSALDTSTRSGLSSPFMAKLTVADRVSRSKTPRQTPATSPLVSPRPCAMNAVDIFSGPSKSKSVFPLSTISTPSVSPRPLGTPPPRAGGEMERIRQEMLHDNLAHYYEAETRRPDYLKRQKRTLSDTEHGMQGDDDRPVGVGIGIMESPHKGRRLKLFQETSDESFEESLMAGGYGRYRTTDWVRQPQPLPTPGPAGPSAIAQTLEEEVAPIVPTEKELLKLKRLAAFRSEPTTKAKLRPVEIEGKGRVLIEVNAEDPRPPVPEPTPTKKRGGGNRRKKKGEVDTPVPDRKAHVYPLAAHPVEQPNWPDDEFPWRLRTEERAEIKRAEEEERMKWIEKFLDRDSDDEGRDDEPPLQDEGPPATWAWDGSEARPPARGRGKYVPLRVDRPEENGSPGRNGQRRTAYFLTDPGDARAALLAKKSVRTLSYRQQKRARGSSKARQGEEEVCICRGYDDGRELVQCDGCQTWYHLQCIGIRSIADLGREEDPWFCRSCEAERASQAASEDLNMMDLISSEPTFVQNEEEPRTRSYEGPFFTAPNIEDSPVSTWSRLPKTPTRNGRANGGSLDLGSTSSLSGSSWMDSSRHGPSTPHQLMSGPRVYTHSTPGSYDLTYSYDDAFDPTSTPSRGIKFNAPFATPKTTLWPAGRSQSLFQTPSRATTGGARDVTALARAYETAGPLDPAPGAGGGSYSPYPYPRLPQYDDSPIRRDRDVPPDRSRAQGARRILESPLTNALSGSPHFPTLDGSPIMRAKGKERSHDHGAPLQRLTSLS